jgi:hypothetical protein
MFNPQLNWWQRIVKHLAYLLMVFVPLLVSFLLVASKLGIEKKVVTETNYVNSTTKVKDIGELQNGDVVLFNGMTVCVSSFQTSNILRMGLDDEPPIIIYFRKAGDCI